MACRKVRARDSVLMQHCLILKKNSIQLDRLMSAVAHLCIRVFKSCSHDYLQVCNSGMVSGLGFDNYVMSPHRVGHEIYNTEPKNFYL